MSDDIKSVMANHTHHWKLDKTLAKRLGDFVKSYLNANEDHVNFYGGNLTGVHVLRFTTKNRMTMCEDILGIDDLAIRDSVRALPHIGDTWVRGTDGLNLALIYLVHLLHNDTKLPAKLRYQMQVDCLLILQYKFLSSIITAYFHHPVNLSVALAVYQNLNGKFAIKRYATWQQLLLTRCEAILIREDTHRDTIKTFQPDDKVQYMITDIQGRLKSMILNIYSVTMEIKDSEDRVGVSSAMIELDGELTIRDIQRKQNDYLMYIRQVAKDQREFIKMDLVDVLDATITTLPRKLFLDVLANFSKQWVLGDKNAGTLIEEIIFYSFKYFSENRETISDTRDYAKLISTMKNLYTAGKSTTPSVLKSRQLADRINKKAVKTTNEATKAALRIGLILYILIRALTRDHYT